MLDYRKTSPATLYPLSPILNYAMSSSNLVDALFEKASSNPGKVCIHTVDARVVTYETLFAQSSAYANALKSLGVKVGDRVAVQVDKSVEKLFLYLATLRMGAVFLPLNTAYTLNELRFFIEDAEPSVIVCRKSMQDALQPVAKEVNAQLVTLEQDSKGSLVDLAASESANFETVPREANDLAAILYTSGTTGRSKGAMLSHDNLLSNTRALFDVWQYREEDVLIHALPIFHTHGLFVACNLTFYAGASMIFFEKFDAKEIIAALPGATVMMGVPTFYTRLLAEASFTGAVTQNMRVFISGSAPMNVEVHKRFEERTGLVVLERYGMTEISMMTSNPFEGERRQGTVGFPLPGSSIRVANPETAELLPANEVGVLEVTGPNVFQGYWRLSEKTKGEFRNDGYFITGDLGTISTDGYVTIVGRAKDLIISGGFNVYPKEVEKLLNKMEGIAESAVIGVPHPDWGEAVVAVIVADGTAFREDIVIAELKDRLASYKIPKRVFEIDELPRNAMAKVQKQVLREQFEGLFGS